MIASLRHKVEAGILTPTEALRYLEDIADSYGIRGLHLLADHYYDLAKTWAKRYL